MKTYDQILSDQIEAKRRLLTRLRASGQTGQLASRMIIARVEGEVTAYTTALNVYRSMHPAPRGFDDILLTQMGEVAEELLEVEGDFQPFPISWRNLLGEDVLNGARTPETLLKLAQSAVALTVGEPDEGETFQDQPPEVWIDRLLAEWSAIHDIAALAWEAAKDNIPSPPS